MPLYLGIDGGGTKTTCVVGDDTSVLATASAPGSNVIRLGEAEAKLGLQAAISQACCQASISPLRVVSACVGVAGATNDEVNATVRKIVRQALPNAHVVVVGDMEIAREAALGDGPGVIAIAGTGSIAYGRNTSGETARAGGWGYAISDEGSGQWIGRRAVAESMRAFDAARENILFDRVLQCWSLGSRDELIRHANATPAPNFAELFPVVTQAADDGDGLAADILCQAGAELAQLSLVVLHRLWKPNDKVRIGVAGGVFANSAQVRMAFNYALQKAWPGVSVCFEITDPVMGALGMARRTHVNPGAV